MICPCSLITRKPLPAALVVVASVLLNPSRNGDPITSLGSLSLPLIHT